MGFSLNFNLGALGRSRKESILPRPDYAPGFRGRVLIDRSDTAAGAIFPLIFGALFAGVPLLIVLADHKGEAVFHLVLILFFLVGGFVFSMGLRTLWIAYRFSPGKLTPSSLPVRCGETFTIEYQRKSKTGSLIDMMSARLYLQETAIYQRGTDTVTDVEVVTSEDLGTVGAGQDGAGVYRGSWSLQIPPEGPSSFDSRRNKVNWRVEVTIFAEGREVDKSTFTLIVIPELAVARSA